MQYSFSCVSLVSSKVEWISRVACDVCHARTERAVINVRLTIEKSLLSEMEDHYSLDCVSYRIRFFETVYPYQSAEMPISSQSLYETDTVYFYSAEDIEPTFKISHQLVFEDYLPSDTQSTLNSFPKSIESIDSYDNGMFYTYIRLYQPYCIC